MRCLLMTCLTLLTTFSAHETIQAQTVHFSFQGTGGSGVLASNENPPVPGGGSGGILTGVTLNLQTNELSLDVGWGSFHGFTDLTSDISLLNIHGPTASAGSAAWTENAGVIETLNGYDPSFDSGQFNGTVNLTNDEVTELMEGRYYLHFHTDIHSGGEARGYFTVERIETEVQPDSFATTRGVLFAGSPSDLRESDNSDVSIRRNATDIQSRTEMVIAGTSVSSTPVSMTIVLEGSVFARSNVIQSIELFDYVSASWVEIDSRNATRFSDSTVSQAVAGDLTRFVDSETLGMQARVRYFSPNPRQQFTSNTDQFLWIIGE